MTSISLTSGKPSMASRVNSEPNAFVGSTAGTSSGGSSMPHLPGADCSKMRPSFWLTCVRALPTFFTGASRSVILGFKSYSSLNGSFQNAAHGGGEAFNFGARPGFGDADDGALGEFGIVRAEGERADDFFPQQVAVDHFHRARKFQREFVERWAGESAAHAGNVFQLGLGEAGFGEILQRLLAQTFFADQAEVNCGGERVESFIGADVGCGLLAADVLFARG